MDKERELKKILNKKKRTHSGARFVKARFFILSRFIKV
jgi:hypothetical protein